MRWSLIQDGHPGGREVARVGPLLTSALKRLEAATSPGERSLVLRALEARVGSREEERLAAVVQRRPVRPRRNESWEEFRARIRPDLDAVNAAVAGGAGQPLFLSNAVAGAFTIEQLQGLSDLDRINFVELDPVVNPVAMDDASKNVGAKALRERMPDLTGAGVRVAILDTGVDGAHPFLQVAEAVSTCGEDVSVPGLHATHCAGALASRDEAFPGIAPDVALLNVKVLRHNNRGAQTNIARGIDAALELKADILSISLGFNHLPTWSDRGHGWSCPDGRCPLCTAVDNAVLLGAIVVAAAGNEHARAEALRRFGASNSFDTELTCPGQARRAIAIGAVTKDTHVPAEFSSRGPTSYGRTKPDICGPGVNITSTAPVPRLANGELVPNPLRADLFARDSGTSMATPIVAGAIALILQDRRAKGQSTSQTALMRALKQDALVALGLPANVAGQGRIDLSGFGTA
jgi:serine protease AprX